MVRIGVIGLGFMGATHIAAYAAAQAAGWPCELVAVCDRKEPRRRGELWDVGGNAVSEISGQKLAFDPERVRGYEQADALIADPEIDLISICTRTDTHIDLATRALRAGKHVLLEKPVSLIADEIRRLDVIARECGKICIPAMCMRFWPAWVWLKARIDDGQFGACRSATFTRLASMPGWSGFFAEGQKSGGRWSIYISMMRILCIGALANRHPFLLLGALAQAARWIMSQRCTGLTLYVARVFHRSLLWSEQQKNTGWKPVLHMSHQHMPLPKADGISTKDSRFACVISRFLKMQPLTLI